MLDHRIKKCGHRGGKPKTGELVLRSGVLRRVALTRQVGKGLLEDIQGVLLVAGKSSGQMVNPIPIPPVEHFEGVRVAFIYQFD